MIWVYLIIISGSVIFSLQIVTRYRQTADRMGFQIEDLVRNQEVARVEIEENNVAKQAAAEQGKELEEQITGLQKSANDLQKKINTWAERNEKQGKFKIHKS
jgi:uncharacterized protein HemX